MSVTWQSQWRLDLPASAPPAEGHPLLVALHGYTESGERLRDRLGGLDGASFAVLYPDGPFPLEVRSTEEARIGYAWYQYTGDQAQFARGLAFAEDYLDRLVETVAAAHPIDGRRVALLGYSQGGYVASVTALRRPSRYCGLAALATRIKIEAIDDLAAARDLPVLVVHGEKDRAIPFARQMEMVEALTAAGIGVEVVSHPGGHGLRADQAPAIVRFVGRVLDA